MLFMESKSPSIDRITEQIEVNNNIIKSCRKDLNILLQENKCECNYHKIEMESLQITLSEISFQNFLLRAYFNYRCVKYIAKELKLHKNSCFIIKIGDEIYQLKYNGDHIWTENAAIPSEQATQLMIDQVPTNQDCNNHSEFGNAHYHSEFD